MPEIPTPNDLTERVMRVIAATQHIPIEKISPDSTFQELGIDSLDGINILFALENEFDVNIPDEAAKNTPGIPEMTAGIRQLLEDKQKAAGAEA
jgi:acyl carrier protein